MSDANIEKTERKGESAALTRVGQVRLVSLDLVRDVLAALAKLLHVIRDDGSVSSRVHF